MLTMYKILVSLISDGCQSGSVQNASTFLTSFSPIVGCLLKIIAEVVTPVSSLFPPSRTGGLGLDRLGWLYKVVAPFFAQPRQLSIAIEIVPSAFGGIIHLEFAAIFSLTSIRFCE